MPPSIDNDKTSSEATIRPPPATGDDVTNHRRVIPVTLLDRMLGQIHTRQKTSSNSIDRDIHGSLVQL